MTASSKINRLTHPDTPQNMQAVTDYVEDPKGTAAFSSLCGKR
jgi:hypothetical protein